MKNSNVQSIEDPRGDLYHKLLDSNINKETSFLITIDAGIGLVNKDYIEDLKLTKKQKRAAGKHVQEFYWNND